MNKASRLKIIQDAAYLTERICIAERFGFFTVDRQTNMTNWEMVQDAYSILGKDFMKLNIEVHRAIGRKK